MKRNIKLEHDLVLSYADFLNHHSQELGHQKALAALALFRTCEGCRYTEGEEPLCGLQEASQFSPLGSRYVF